jgi:hypothetical protein
MFRRCLLLAVLLLFSATAFADVITLLDTQYSGVAAGSGAGLDLIVPNGTSFTASIRETFDGSIYETFFSANGGGAFSCSGIVPLDFLGLGGSITIIGNPTETSVICSPFFDNYTFGFTLHGFTAVGNRVVFNDPNNPLNFDLEVARLTGVATPEPNSLYLAGCGLGFFILVLQVARVRHRNRIH